MKIIKYKVTKFSKINKVYGSNGRISYYYFDIYLTDMNETTKEFVLTKIVYTRRELKKIMKLKYHHIICN